MMQTDRQMLQLYTTQFNLHAKNAMSDDQAHRSSAGELLKINYELKACISMLFREHCGIT
jgi:hypothetical protein